MFLSLPRRSPPFHSICSGDNLPISDTLTPTAELRLRPLPAGAAARMGGVRVVRLRNSFLDSRVSQSLESMSSCPLGFTPAPKDRTNHRAFKNLNAKPFLVQRTARDSNKHRSGPVLAWAGADLGVVRGGQPPGSAGCAKADLGVVLHPTRGEMGAHHDVALGSPGGHGGIAMARVAMYRHHVVTDDKVGERSH